MAISTMYRGIEYRSRLEARWASFFTRLGWGFEYEPFDGDGYIPDFLICGHRPMLVEIKPATTVSEYVEPVQKVTEGLRNHWGGPVWLAGMNPLPGYSVNGSRDIFAGFLLEDLAGTAGIVNDGCVPAFWHHENPIWGVWSEARQSAYPGSPTPTGAPEAQRYRLDDLAGTLTKKTRESLSSLWADAVNDAKWRGYNA